MKSISSGFLACLSSIIISQTAYSQQSIFIEANAIVGASRSTQIAFSGNLTNSSTVADFSKADLILTGAGQTLTNSSGEALSLGGLVVDGSGNKNFIGHWEIAKSLTFNNGLVVTSGTDSKIVHTVSVGLPGQIVVNNTSSYVNGAFYSRGTGTRFFPIGLNSGYFPAQLSNVSDGNIEIGMQIVASNAGLTHGTEITDVFTGYHWQLIDPSNTLTGAGISVSSLGPVSNFIDPNLGVAVVGAPEVNGAAVSFGGSLSGDFVSSNTPFTAAERIFTVATIGTEFVNVIIRNLITPNGDNVNDFLEIQDLQLFTDNKVTLLDRWGGKVKEWTGYVNGAADASHDLSKINTGNYICILEYTDGNAKKKLSQMVTIINQ